MERPDQVLSRVDVDRGLPTDRGVGHAQEGRRGLRDAYATEIGGRYKAGHISHAAAAERDDAAVPADARRGETVPESRSNTESFCGLSSGDAEGDGVEPGSLERSHHVGRVARRPPGIGDEGDAPAPSEVREVRPDVIEEARPDQ